MKVTMKMNMKVLSYSFLALSTLIAAAGHSGWAQPTHRLLGPDSLPTPLACTSSDRALRSFKILRFSTSPNDAPHTDLGANGDSLQIGPVSVEFCANDSEGTNSYCWLFFANDLQALADGEKTSVMGLVTYINAQSPEPRTTSVNCQKIQR